MILHKSVSVTTILMARLSRYWSGELECLKGDLRPKRHPCFYGIPLLVLSRKRLSQSLFGALISFAEAMMLQRFEFIVSDVIPANLQNFSHQVFFAYFCKFYEEKTFNKVLWYSCFFLKNFEISTKVTSFTWINTHNMLMVSKYNANILCRWSLLVNWK